MYCLIKTTTPIQGTGLIHAKELYQLIYAPIVRRQSSRKISKFFLISICII